MFEVLHADYSAVVTTALHDTACIKLDSQHGIHCVISHRSLSRQSTYNYTSTDNQTPNNQQK